MANVTFITGNQNKVDFLTKFLNYPVEHRKIDLEEIQSLDFRKIADHKAREAYKIVRSPVLVDDNGLSFNVLGRLPGTFMKWFLDEVNVKGLCQMLDSYNDRSAVAEVCMAYFDGTQIEFFEGKTEGYIAEHPRGKEGFGWNPIFIPKGPQKTYAEMNDEETEKFSLRTTTVYPQIKKFLESLEK